MSEEEVREQVQILLDGFEWNHLNVSSSLCTDSARRMYSLAISKLANWLDPPE